MNQKRWAEIPKLIAKVDAEIRKLQSEKQVLEAERTSVSFENLMKFMPSWNGETITGRTVHIDYTNWKALIETGGFTYVVIDVEELRKVNEPVALVLAKTFVERTFPGLGATASVKINPDGRVETFQIHRDGALGVAALGA